MVKKVKATKVKVVKSNRTKKTFRQNWKQYC